MGGISIEETELPGIGVRQDFVINSGRRMGVITYRDGRSELIVSSKEDLDSCVASIALTPSEANALAGLLGAPQVVAHLEEQHSAVAGITTEQFPISPGSKYDGRILGDTELRTRTGASIVAIVRSGVVHPSPRPDFTFESGDLVVVVGTTDGLEMTAEILNGA